MFLKKKMKKKALKSLNKIVVEKGEQKITSSRNGLIKIYRFLRFQRIDWNFFWLSQFYITTKPQ